MCFVPMSNCATQFIGPNEWPSWILEMGVGRPEVGFCGKPIYPMVPELCQISLAGLQTAQTRTPVSQTFA